MITCLFGKQGGGKSMYMLRLILDELKNGNRPIVTNLPLKLEEMCDYIGDDSPYERILILNEETMGKSDKVRLQDMRYFFLYRGFVDENKLIDGRAPKRDELETVFKIPLWNLDDQMDLTPYYKDENVTGCLFVIDEIHKLYPARKSAKFDERVGEYFAEHRHACDDVILGFQFLKQVDLQVRESGANFIQARNRSHEKYSFFRGPPVFQYDHYNELPSKGEGSAKTEMKRLDLKIANLYHTSKQGNATADKGRKAKGIPFIILPLILIALGIGAKSCSKAVPGLISGSAKSEASEIVNAVQTVGANTVSESVKVKSVMTLGNAVIVKLSNGQTLQKNITADDFTVSGNTVTLKNGTTYEFEKIQLWTKPDTQQQAFF